MSGSEIDDEEKEETTEGIKIEKEEEIKEEGISEEKISEEIKEEEIERKEEEIKEEIKERTAKESKKFGFIAELIYLLAFYIFGIYLFVSLGRLPFTILAILYGFLVPALLLLGFKRICTRCKNFAHSCPFYFGSFAKMFFKKKEEPFDQGDFSWRLMPFLVLISWPFCGIAGYLIYYRESTAWIVNLTLLLLLSIAGVYLYRNLAKTCHSGLTGEEIIGEGVTKEIVTEKIVTEEATEESRDVTAIIEMMEEKIGKEKEKYKAMEERISQLKKVLEDIEVPEKTPEEEGAVR